MKFALIGLAAALIAQASANNEISETKAMPAGSDPLVAGNKLVKIAKERGSGVCEGTIYYGIDTRWMTKTYASGPFECTNGYFGHDPAVGKGKSCYCEAIDTWDMDRMTDLTNDWYRMVAIPFFEENKADIESAVIKKITGTEGELMETCELGTQCRVQSTKRYKKEIKSDWEQLIKSFNRDIRAELLKTQVTISNSYDDAVECEIDFPCCTTPETTVINYYTKISNWKKEIWTLETHLVELETRKWEIEIACPDEVLVGAI